MKTFGETYETVLNTFKHFNNSYEQLLSTQLGSRERIKVAESEIRPHQARFPSPRCPRNERSARVSIMANLFWLTPPVQECVPWHTACTRPWQRPLDLFTVNKIKDPIIEFFCEISSCLPLSVFSSKSQSFRKQFMSKFKSSLKIPEIVLCFIWEDRRYTWLEFG